MPGTGIRGAVSAPADTSQNESHVVQEMVHDAGVVVSEAYCAAGREYMYGRLRHCLISRFQNRGLAWCGDLPVITQHLELGTPQESDAMQAEKDRMMLLLCLEVRSCMLAGHCSNDTAQVYPLSSHLLAK